MVLVGCNGQASPNGVFFDHVTVESTLAFQAHGGGIYLDGTYNNTMHINVCLYQIFQLLSSLVTFSDPPYYLLLSPPQVQFPFVVIIL